MAIAIAIIFVTLIICVTILVGVYMYYCGEDGIKMFSNPHYEERIRKLEKILETEEEKK